MSIPTHGLQSVESETGTSSLATKLPSDAALDDVLFLFVTLEVTGADMAVSGGWTPVGPRVEQTGPTTGYQTRVWWKAVDAAYIEAGKPAPTISWSGAHRCKYHMITIHDAKVAAPVSAYAAAAAPEKRKLLRGPSAEVAEDESLLLLLGSTYESGQSIDTTGVSFPIEVLFNGGIVCAVREGEVLVGPSGDFDLNFNEANWNAAWQLVVAPAEPPPAPVNTEAPAISGTPSVGSTLTASEGTWSGEVEDLTYRWQIAQPDGDRWTNLFGREAVSSSYEVKARDKGRRIRCLVTASNRGGSTEAASSALSVDKAPLVIPRVSGVGLTALGHRHAPVAELWTGATIPDFTPPSSHTSNDPLIQCAPGAITEVPDPLGSGEKVLRMRVNDADVYPVTPTDNPRAEMLSPSAMNEGGVYAERFKFLVPEPPAFPLWVPGWCMVEAVYGAPQSDTGAVGTYVNEDKVLWQRNATYGWDIPFWLPREPNAWYDFIRLQRHSEVVGFVELRWRKTNAEGTTPWTQVVFFDPATSYNPGKYAPTKHLMMKTRDFATNQGLNHAKILHYRKAGMFETADILHGRLTVEAA